MRVAFFPGKGTPLKRYKPYFPNIELYIPNNDEPDVILCHSLGYKHAVEFCRNNDISPKLVVMDGVILDENVEDLDIVFFCPVDREKQQVTEIITYEIDEQLKHYPYMNKNIRDKIVNELQ